MDLSGPFFIDDPEWDVTNKRVKELLAGTSLKRAVDRAWIALYVRSLLWPWHSQQIRQVFVDEVRAYRRDHHFYECV